jgi:hypothetical protein
VVSPQCGGTPAVLPATTTGLFVAWLAASSKITGGEVIRYTGVAPILGAWPQLWLLFQCCCYQGVWYVLSS